MTAPLLPNLPYEARPNSGTEPQRQPGRRESPQVWPAGASGEVSVALSVNRRASPMASPRYIGEARPNLGRKGPFAAPAGAPLPSISVAAAALDTHVAASAARIPRNALWIAGRTTGGGSKVPVPRAGLLAPYRLNQAPRCSPPHAFLHLRWPRSRPSQSASRD